MHTVQIKKNATAASPSALEHGAYILLDHRTFLQWMSWWGGTQHESGSASFGIRTFRKPASLVPRAPEAWTAAGAHLHSIRWRAVLWMDERRAEGAPSDAQGLSFMRAGRGCRLSLG
jgi:hypothetical protein